MENRSSGVTTFLDRFLQMEAAGGITLLIAALIALICANSPASGAYVALLSAPVGGTSVAHWINDGLMAIFFLLIGLELKREVLEGELSSTTKAALPVIAAIGGMVVPALLYAALNWSDATLMRGWAIPTATDIAFAVGILALVGPRVPSSLKVFLLALAIIDDLGAIAIIGLFYTEKLSAEAFGLAAVGLALLGLLNWRRVRHITPYLFVGVFVWICVLQSGIHATLAGVAVALAIPLRPGAPGNAPLSRLEDALHPWVSFGILPVFAFANAGVNVTNLSISDLFSPLPLGIAVGLVAGKQIGVFGAAWLAIRFGAGTMPSGATWIQLYGVAVLTGIGFTMSLFIGTLAFDAASLETSARLGVLGGSAVAAVLGFLLLRIRP